jgi:uncharacterized lipoprotein
MGKAVRKILLLLLGILSLAACSRYASVGEDLYLGSQNGPPLIIPPPLIAAYTNNTLFELPPQRQDARITVLPPADSGHS